jgi:lysophospholipase L1-like esterase
MRRRSGVNAWISLIFAAAVSVTTAAPLRVMMIGDSLTEEYRFETPFSAPTTSPLQANTHNWPEIVAARRSTDISFGSYESTLGYYVDLRNSGYSYNYGVPAFTTDEWVRVTQSTVADLFGGALEALRYQTKQSLSTQVAGSQIGVVVIMLGGNDLNSAYGAIYNDDVTPTARLNQITTNLRTIHAFIRSKNATVPIVIATMPDVGATAKVSTAYNDPVKRARARQRIAAANQSVIALAAELGSQVARIDTLTDRLFDEVPFQLNGTVFIYPPDDANPPDHLFCHDGFHPSTVGQALITNLILDATNRATNGAIPLLTNREILGDVLGLNPDQPYLNWAGNAGGMLENPDGDGSPNLVEFLLNTSSLIADSPFQFSQSGQLFFTPSAERLRFASLDIEESSTLNGWSPVPAGRKVIQPSGTWEILPPADRSRNFYRLTATPKP